MPHACRDDMHTRNIVVASACRSSFLQSAQKEDDRQPMEHTHGRARDEGSFTIDASDDEEDSGATPPILWMKGEFPNRLLPDRTLFAKMYTEPWHIGSRSERSSKHARS